MSEFLTSTTNSIVQIDIDPSLHSLPSLSHPEIAKLMKVFSENPEKWSPKMNEEKAHYCDADGVTLLLCAAKEGREELVLQLLESGAEVNNNSKQTPLCQAEQMVG